MKYLFLFINSTKTYSYVTTEKMFKLHTHKDRASCPEMFLLVQQKKKKKTMADINILINKNQI